MSVDDSFERTKLCLLRVAVVQYFVKELVEHHEIILDVFLVHFAHDS